MIFECPFISISHLDPFDILGRCPQTKSPSVQFINPSRTVLPSVPFAVITIDLIDNVFGVVKNESYILVVDDKTKELINSTIGAFTLYESGCICIFFVPSPS